jgi:hypothetical protein
MCFVLRDESSQHQAGTAPNVQRLNFRAMQTCRSSKMCS